MASISGREDWHAMEVEHVLEALNSQTGGLTKEEAESRLREFGPNELKLEKRVSPLKIFARQFKSILMIILIIAAAASLVLAEAIDALFILAILTLSAVLGFFQEYRAERALEALKKMLSPTALLVRDGGEAVVPVREIVPGDILVLNAGDKVPADARVVEATRFQLGEASLTGESTPVDKKTTPIPSEASLADRANMVFSGTEVTYGKGKAVVVSSGMNTELGRIAKEVTTSVEEETPLERRMKELGKWLGSISFAVVLIVGTVAILREFLVEGSIRVDFVLEMVLFGVALAVAAVPEALPAIVTGGLAIGMRRMAKRNALVRKMPAVETLGSTTVICSDKTGTLTKGEMTVRKIYVAGEIINVTGVGYEPKGSFHGSGDVLESEPFSHLMKASILCNDADLGIEEGKWRVRGDPTEGALVVVAVKAGFKKDELRLQYTRLHELPFSSERKRMTTVHSEPTGIRVAYMKGAPEIVLERCLHAHEVDGIRKLTEEEKESTLRVNEQMAEGALRVLAVAYKQIQVTGAVYEEDVERDLTFLGLIGMMDPPRDEAIEAVNSCKMVKIKPVMITGDHALTAIAVAKEMGIYQEGDIVLTGEELEKTSDEELERIVEKVTVYARVPPAHKLKIVRAWKRRGHVVAMTGDGVNDAPALKHADIGIAMGITGTEVSREAASMVLTDDNFATIVKAVEMGRWIYDNIKKYLTYLLQANIVEVVVLSSLVLAGFPLPLLPAAILYINLATDGLPAIALGVGPPDPDVMKRPPRSPRETIFTKDVKFFLLRAVLIEIPLLLLAYLWLLPNGLEFSRSGVFLVFIFIELTLALNCRSLKYTVLDAKPHRFLIISVIWEIALVLILVNVTAVREAFGIAFPGPIQFALAIGLSLVTFLSVETLKHSLRGHLKLPKPTVACKAQPR